MTARSLGFATDLAVLALEGARIERRPDAVVVRMPHVPAFRWGNFLLVDEAGSPAARLAEHAARFPGAGFATVGVDAPAPVVDEGVWRAAGFDVERLVVLRPGPPGRRRPARCGRCATTSGPTSPPSPPRG